MSKGDIESQAQAYQRRRDDLDMTIVGLGKSKPGEPRVSTYDDMLARADHVVAIARQAARLSGLPQPELPSITAIRLHEEALSAGRPPEIRGFHWPRSLKPIDQEEYKLAKDPEAILADEPDGTVAIREDFNDNDALGGSITISWLKPEDLADARRYVKQVGVDFSEPGPGDDDGRYYYREIFVKHGPGQVEKVSPYGP